MELICVTLNAPDDWNDHIKLYDKFFGEYELRSASEGMRFSVPRVSKSSDCSYVIADADYRMPVKKGAEMTVTVFPFWNIFAPVKAGEYAAKALVKVDGKPTGEYYLSHSADILN